jgi:hypothetical protein
VRHPAHTGPSCPVQVVLLHAGAAPAPSAAALLAAGAVAAHLPVAAVLHDGSAAGHQLARRLLPAGGDGGKGGGGPREEVSEALGAGAARRGGLAGLWARASAQAGGEGGAVVVVVTQGTAHSELVCAVLGMGAEHARAFRCRARCAPPAAPCRPPRSASWLAGWRAGVAWCAGALASAHAGLPSTRWRAAACLLLAAMHVAGGLPGCIAHLSARRSLRLACR